MSNFTPIQASGQGAEWIESNGCFKCSMKFSLMKRPSHCRHCGNIFCKAHSSQMIRLPYSHSQQQREKVCDDCHFRFKQTEEPHQARLLDLLKPAYITIISGGGTAGVSYINEESAPKSDTTSTTKPATLLTTTTPSTTPTTTVLSTTSNGPTPPLIPTAPKPPPVPENTPTKLPPSLPPSTANNNTNHNDDDDEDVGNDNSTTPGTIPMQVVDLDLDTILQTQSSSSKSDRTSLNSNRTPFTRGSISLAPGHVMSTANYFQFVATNLSTTTTTTNSNPRQSSAQMSSFNNLDRAATLCDLPLVKAPHGKSKSMEDSPIEKFSTSTAFMRLQLPNIPLPELPNSSSGSPLLDRIGSSDGKPNLERMGSSASRAKAGQNNQPTPMTITYGTPTTLDPLLRPHLEQAHKDYTQQYQDRTQENEKVLKEQQKQHDMQNKGLFTTTSSPLATIPSDQSLLSLDSSGANSLGLESIFHQPGEGLGNITTNNINNNNINNNNKNTHLNNNTNNNTMSYAGISGIPRLTETCPLTEHQYAAIMQSLLVAERTTVNQYHNTQSTSQQPNQQQSQKDDNKQFHPIYLTDLITDENININLHNPNNLNLHPFRLSPETTISYLIRLLLSPFSLAPGSQEFRSSFFLFHRSLISSPTLTSIFLSYYLQPPIFFANDRLFFQSRLTTLYLVTNWLQLHYEDAPAIAPFVSYVLSQIPIATPTSPTMTSMSLSQNHTMRLKPAAVTAAVTQAAPNKKNPFSNYSDDFLFQHIVDMSPPTTALQLKLIEQQIITARSNLVALFAQAKQVYYVKHVESYGNTIAKSAQYLQHHILSRQTFVKSQIGPTALTAMATSGKLPTTSTPATTTTATTSATVAATNFPSGSVFPHLATAFDPALLPTSLAPIIAPPLFEDIIQPASLNPQSFLPLNLKISPLTLAQILTFRNTALFSTIRLRDCTQHSWIKHPRIISDIINGKISNLWNKDPHNTQELPKLLTRQPTSQHSTTTTTGGDSSCPPSPSNQSSLGRSASLSSSPSSKHTIVTFGSKGTSSSSSTVVNTSPKTTTVGLNKNDIPIIRSSAITEEHPLFHFDPEYTKWTPQHNGLILLAEEFNRVSQWVTSTILQAGLKQQLHNEYTRFLQFKNSCRLFEILSSPDLPLSNPIIAPLPTLPTSQTIVGSTLPPKPSFNNTGTSSVTMGSLPNKPSFNGSTSPTPKFTPSSLPSKPSFSALPNRPSGSSVTPSFAPSIPTTKAQQVNGGINLPLGSPLKNNPFIINNATTGSNSSTTPSFKPNTPNQPLPEPIAPVLKEQKPTPESIYLPLTIEPLTLTIKLESIIAAKTTETTTKKSTTSLHALPSGPMITMISNETLATSSAASSVVSSPSTTTTTTTTTTTKYFTSSTTMTTSISGGDGTPGLVLPDNTDEPISEYELLCYARSKGFILSPQERTALLKQVSRFTTTTQPLSSSSSETTNGVNIAMATQISGPIIISAPHQIGTAPPPLASGMVNLHQNTTPVAPFVPLEPSFNATGIPMAPSAPNDPKARPQLPKQPNTPLPPSPPLPQLHIPLNGDGNVLPTPPPIPSTQTSPFHREPNLPPHTSTDIGNIDDGEGIAELTHVQVLDWNDDIEPQTRRRTSALSVVSRPGTLSLNTPSAFRPLSATPSPSLLGGSNTPSLSSNNNSGHGNVLPGLPASFSLPTLHTDSDSLPPQPTPLPMTNSLPCVSPTGGSVLPSQVSMVLPSPVSNNGKNFFPKAGPPPLPTLNINQQQVYKFSIIPPKNSTPRSLLSSGTANDGGNDEGNDGVLPLIPYDKTQLAQTIKVFLDMSQFLFKRNDFFTLGAIMTGLSHTTIQNDPVFAQVVSEKDYSIIWTSCRAAVSNNANYSLYRALWAKATNEYLLLLSNQSTLDYNLSKEDDDVAGSGEVNPTHIVKPLVPKQLTKRGSIQELFPTPSNFEKKSHQEIYETLLNTAVKAFHFNKGTFNWESNSSFKPRLFVPNDSSSDRAVFVAQYLTLSTLLLSQNPILAARKVVDIGINTTATGLGINHGIDSAFVKHLPTLAKLANKIVANATSTTTTPIPPSGSTTSQSNTTSSSSTSLPPPHKLNTHDPNTGKPFLLTPVHERIGQPNFTASKIGNHCEYQSIVSFYLNLKKIRSINRTAISTLQLSGSTSFGQSHSLFTKPQPDNGFVTSVSTSLAKVGSSQSKNGSNGEKPAIPLPLLPCVMKDLFVLQDGVNLFVDPNQPNSKTVNKTPIDLVTPLQQTHNDFEAKLALQQQGGEVATLNPLNNGTTTTNNDLFNSAISTPVSTSRTPQMISNGGLIPPTPPNQSNPLSTSTPYHNNMNNSNTNDLSDDIIRDDDLFSLDESHFSGRGRSQAVLNQHAKQHSTQRRSILYDTSSFFKPLGSGSTYDQPPAPTSLQPGAMAHYTSSSALDLSPTNTTPGPLITSLSSPFDLSLQPPLNGSTSGTNHHAMLNTFRGSAHHTSSNRPTNLNGSFSSQSSSLLSVSQTNHHPDPISGEKRDGPKLSPIPLNALSNELSRMVSFHKIQQQWLALQPLCIAIHASYIHNIGVPMVNDLANLGLYVSQSDSYTNRPHDEAATLPSVHLFPTNHFATEYSDPIFHYYGPKALAAANGDSSLCGSNLQLQTSHINGNNTTGISIPSLYAAENSMTDLHHHLTPITQNLGYTGPGDNSQILYVIHNPTIHRHRRLPPPLPLIQQANATTSSPSPSSPPIDPKPLSSALPVTSAPVFGHIYGDPIPQNALKESQYALEPQNALYNALLNENRFFLDTQVPRSQIINSFKSLPLPPFPIPSPQPFIASNFVQYVLHELSTPVGTNIPRVLAPHGQLTLDLSTNQSITPAQLSKLQNQSFARHPGLPPILDQAQIDALPKQDRKQYIQFLSSLTTLILFPSKLRLPWDLGLTQLNATARALMANTNNPYLSQLSTMTQSTNISSIQSQTLSSERLSSFYSYTSSLSSQPQPILPDIVIHNCQIPVPLYRIIVFLRQTLRRAASTGPIVTSDITADDHQLLNLLGHDPLAPFSPHYKPPLALPPPSPSNSPRSKSGSGFFIDNVSKSGNNDDLNTKRDSANSHNTIVPSFIPRSSLNGSNNAFPSSQSTSSIPQNNSNNITEQFGLGNLPLEIAISHDGSLLDQVELSREVSESFKSSFIRSFKGFLHPDWDILLHFGAALHTQLDQIDGLYVSSPNGPFSSGTINGIHNNPTIPPSPLGSPLSSKTPPTIPATTSPCTSNHPHIGCGVANNALTTMSPPLSFPLTSVSLLLSELLLILPPHHYQLLYTQLPQHTVARLHHLTLWQSLRGTTRDDEWCWMVHGLVNPREQMSVAKANQIQQQQRSTLLANSLLAQIKNSKSLQHDYVLGDVQDDWLMDVIQTDKVIKLE